MPSMDPADPVDHAVRAWVHHVGPGLYGVACSGGADSMALLHATIAAAGAPHVIALAIDHGLTPASAATAEAVATWARGQGAAAVVRRVTVARRASLEAAARDARYAALDALADALGLSTIFVGHTARDQAETVVLRILRGTGPAGLAAIPAERGRIARPLLALDRAAIEAYVAAHALPTWTDPMNADHRLTRVRVRETILPVLRSENAQLDAALCRLAASAREWTAVIDAAAAPHARFPIDCAALARMPIAIRKRAIALAVGRDLGAGHLAAIDRLVCAPTAGQVALAIPGGAIARTYDRLERRVPLTSSTSPRVAPVGHAFRTWQAGDRMRPLRLRGRSRKLSDLYADARVPRDVRATAVVLTRTTDHAIVWAEHIGPAFDVRSDLVPL